MSPWHHAGPHTFQGYPHRPHLPHSPFYGAEKAGSWEAAGWGEQTGCLPCAAAGGERSFVGFGGGSGGGGSSGPGWGTVFAVGLLVGIGVIGYGVYKNVNLSKASIRGAKRALFEEEG
jgi:hypothetical protein